MYSLFPLFPIAYIIFLRNIIYAMGNSGKKKYIKLLEEFEGHSVDFISEAANWSISELKKNE